MREDNGGTDRGACIAPAAGDRHTAGDLPPSGAPPGALKTPRPIAVEAEAGSDGPLPRWVVWRGRRRRIAEIVDEWRVDDEWWRAEVRRHYFAVLLAEGSHLTVFCDLLEETRWEQRY
jgi:hypothetical protein